jgi:hypothetical protein
VSLWLLLAAVAAQGQEPFRQQRLRSPATAKDVIGGESHNLYVIRARKGQIMRVQLSWRRARYYGVNNHAEFGVIDSPTLNSDRPEFGKWSNNGKRWTGTIPRTGDYYVYVVAHPIAHYTLRVTLR